MPVTFDVGDAPLLVVTLTDEAGESLPDPLPEGTTITFGIRTPSGDHTVYTDDDAELLRDGDDWTVRWPITEPGIHRWGIRVVGAVQLAEEASFLARPLRAFAD